MLNDIFTLIWKELKEVLLARSSGRLGLLSLLIFIVVFAVMAPLEWGLAWFTSLISIGIAMWLPIFLVAGLVTDAFAGERERHTLETLLSSRLSDSAILFGKIGASVIYGWIFVLIILLVSAVTINIAYPQGGIKFFPLGLFAAGLGFSLLTCLLIASLGVLISLRSATARIAYQKLSIAMLVVVMAPSLLLPVLTAELQAPSLQFLEGINLGMLALVASVVLITAVAVLIGIAKARFQRAKLILD